MSDQAAPDGNGTEAIKFTFEEQVTAYSSLYAMALLCVIWGSIRSLKTISRTVEKKRNIEASISLREAYRFPLSASLVLFGLYVAFKGPFEVSNQLIAKAQPHVPAYLLLPLEKVRDHFEKSNTSEGSAVFGKNILERARGLHPAVDRCIDTTAEYSAIGLAHIKERSQFIEPYTPELNKANLIFMLLVLLCFEGSSALAVILKPIFSLVLRLLPIGDRFPKRNNKYLFSLKRSKKDIPAEDIVDSTKDEVEYLFAIDFDTHYLVAFFFTAFVGISHVYQRHWITNNLIGIAFSIYGIENLHLASFKAGMLLLSGLFFYDIFWVFGTDVMTTVAKSIDAPILLQFPQDIYRNGWLTASKYGMLGLGDIVIPGIFAALLHRFDHYVGSKKTGGKVKSRFYFITVVLGYMVGLSVTMVIMHYFKSAQPALLYLVPSCIILPLFLSLLRGEFTELWNYTEEHLVDPEGKNEKTKKEKAKKQNPKKND